MKRLWLFRTSKDAISGQLRIIFDAWKRENLTEQDQKFLKAEMREKKLQEERLDDKALGSN